MKIYVLGGYAPDLFEGTVCTLSEVFTDEESARKKMAEIRNDIENLLEECFSGGRLEYYSIDCHETRHNKYTLGSLVSEITITPGNDKHVEMWRNWSTLSIGESNRGFLIDSSEASLSISRSSSFRIASCGISIKEI